MRTNSNAKQDRWKRWLSSGGVAGPETPLGREYRGAIAGYRAVEREFKELGVAILEVQGQRRSAAIRLATLGREVERAAVAEAKRRSASASTPGILTWHPVPKGQLEAALIRATAYDDQRTPAAAARLAFINSLGPMAWFSSLHRGNPLHFVAKFNDIAIADSPGYGNNLYYFVGTDERWQSVFKASPEETARSGAGQVPCSSGWQNRIRQMVGRHR